MSFLVAYAAFAETSPFLAFLLLCAVYYTLKQPYYLTKRYLRHLDIQKHGWPTNPEMDSDGDIIKGEK